MPENNNNSNNNAPTLFDFKGHPVRTVVDQKDNPWFVAADVCKILGLTNTTVALEGLDDDEKSQLKESLSSHSGGRPAVIINESGLYALIFRSRKPEAKAFSKWVRSDVLPALRKGGIKITKGGISSQELQIVVDQLRALEHEVVQVRPYVEFADKLTDGMTKYTVKQLAKALGVKDFKKIGRILFRAGMLNLRKLKSRSNYYPSDQGIIKGYVDFTGHRDPRNGYVITPGGREFVKGALGVTQGGNEILHPYSKLKAELGITEVSPTNLKQSRNLERFLSLSSKPCS